MYNTDEAISIADAAAESGVPLALYLSQLVHAGLLLELPDSLDPRCRPIPAREAVNPSHPEGKRLHVAGCFCEFVPSPHPDIRPL